MNIPSDPGAPTMSVALSASAPATQTPDRFPRHPLVVPFTAVTIDDIPIVGGKNASLGEMIQTLSSLGVRVPSGFATTADAFRLHLRLAGLQDWIYARLATVDATNARTLAAAGQEIRQRIVAAPLPADLRAQVLAAYRALTAACAKPVDGAVPLWLDVAVRSSATAEDLPTASFAGQHETYLHVQGPEALDTAIRQCMASLFTDRAIAYRVQNKFDHRSVALSVGVQQMVRSDLGCAGTMFTLDTESGFRGVVMIDGSWGLGETVVKGRVNPDEFWIHKSTAMAGFPSVIRRQLGRKTVKLIYASEGSTPGATVVEAPVSTEDQARFVLTNDEVLTLARWGMQAEQQHAARLTAAGTSTGLPPTGPAIDLEWAKDGQTGELFILQARPETVHSRPKTSGSLEVFRLSSKEKPRPVLTGKSVGARIGSGPVRIIRSKADLPTFQPGEVLVAAMTDPDWEPVLRNAAAVVTDHGGRTCHAAIVSREMNLPCVVGTVNGTTALREGQVVTVSCAGGDVGHVYDGAVPFEHSEFDPASLPETRVPLMLNMADPGHAFRLCQLPSAGVGLMRIEFLVSNWIGVHPMALAHPERVPDPAVRAEIERRAAGHASLRAFFVDRLAEGIAQIGAAFHPRPVIVRFSDFKTNEYAGLLGGAPFEPKEDNPMIGFRGASRYYDDRYREGFAMECEALLRVRGTMGLKNVIAMVPFCRTLGEGRAVLGEMANNGLRRGEDGMQVYVMCEIPNNVILAEEFCTLFDGFSIGSNDLTQLTLGIDRDSDVLAPLFDERDPGVKMLIEQVVRVAHSNGRKVGICGEAPSNYPDFAEWLANIGIDSMSLNPDSLPTVARQIAVVAQPPIEVPGSNPG